jgi:hypothetical protein
MSRLCFALIYTAFILPSLLLAPPADGFWCPTPSVGSALGAQW